MTTIKIEPVTRIESHGKLTIEYDEAGTAKSAYFTTPVIRGFESFLVGAPIERVPWLASRVCGVCPVSHAVNAAQTIEKAMGITVPETAEVLREMLVLSQLVDSHALSFVVLSLPDLVPDRSSHSIVDLKSKYPDLFEKGMKLHSLGRSMTANLGGRNVHPANVRIGGMGSNPLLEGHVDFAQTTKDAIVIAEVFLEQLKTWFDEQRETVVSLGSIKSNYMALSDNGVVSFVKGKVHTVDTSGNSIAVFDPDQYLDHLAEEVLTGTYMKAPYLKALGPEAGTLRVNCLARANVNTSFGTPQADHHFKEAVALWQKPMEHSLLSHWVRLIELIYACERIGTLLENPSVKSNSTSVAVDMKDGEAVGCIEAPRGTLFHHYSLASGVVAKANLLVATQNNQLAVNSALKQTLESGLSRGLDQEEIVRQCEMTLRAYDPCISCSTHIVHIKGGTE
jgi:F420-non-reducing hydrogenase large subunit